jgi:sensor domain CHASE-containing protein
MRALIAALIIGVLICSSVAMADQPDKEKLMLRAQALHEKILRLRMEIATSVEEHNKAVMEMKAIIQLLEQMEGGKDA